MRANSLILLCLGIVLNGTEAYAAPPSEAPQATKPSFSSNASWYHNDLAAKSATSNASPNAHKNCAADNSKPKSAMVLVEDPRTGNAVVVKVKDRGALGKSKVMDLSIEAARRLGTISRGMAFVDCMIVNDKK